MTITDKAQRDIFIVQQYRQGKKVRQLAAHHKLTEQAVYQILHRYQAITPSPQKVFTEHEDKDFLDQMNKRNKRELAQEMNLSYSGLFAKKRAAEARMYRRQKG